jgi:hypothetical protein
VRLTLRTLLAYLDDTLEPNEIKQIGQKVAESDAAQELIGRIKQTTRRRRLTTPPATGPNSFDPNTVAEYLDNELSTEQVAELEKLCLESDVHLAEIAACHQILTLVLGEPALVPPTAKERMYGLVSGREAIPFRKAAVPTAAGGAPTHGDGDADETLLLGLPFYRQGSWLRWALPLAAVVLIAGVSVALWQAVVGFGTRANANNQVASNGKSNAAEKDAQPEDKQTDKKQEEKPIDKKQEEKPIDKKQEEKPITPVRDPNTGAQNPDVQPTVWRIAPPSKERAMVGSYYTNPNAPPSLLVQRDAEGNEGWKRVTGGASLHTSDRLVSLPGYMSELRLDSGIRLLLRGMMREFSRDPASDFLLESAVVLHKNPSFDLDFTLDRGRVYFSNHKESGPAKVRLRFGRDAAEVWDLTLKDPGTEVAVDLAKHYTREINYLDGEDPRMELVLQVLSGKAGIRIDYVERPNLSGPPGPGLFVWDNKTGKADGPHAIEKELPIWSKSPPANEAANAMTIALKELSGRMVGNKAPTLVLEESMQSKQPANRVLAVYCLGALDEARKLVDLLGDEDPTHVLEREMAIFTLRRWIARDASQSKLLYDPDPKKRSGILTMTQRYRPKEAERLSILLHDFTDEARRSRETYELLGEYLKSDKVAIAELAMWHLRHMVPGMNDIAKRFNAAEPIDTRQPVADAIEKMVKDGTLPPALQSGGAPAGSSTPPKKK